MLVLLLLDRCMPIYLNQVCYVYHGQNINRYIMFISVYIILHMVSFFVPSHVYFKPAFVDDVLDRKLNAT
jgi:hypothetical protein